MKQLILLGVFAGLVLSRGGVYAGESAAPPLAEVLHRAASAHKPVLLDFGTAWCEPCKILELALVKPDIQPLLSAFVFQRYDAERGPGLPAAERYRIKVFPTLLILDAEGHELLRTNPSVGELAKFLQQAASRASLTEAEATARLNATPEDLGLLFTLVNRAQQRGDMAKVRATLLRIEAADHSKEREDAERAGWQRLVLDLRAALAASAVPLVSDYLHRYPSSAMYTLRLLSAAGADTALLDRELRKAAEACHDGGCMGSLLKTASAIGASDTAPSLAKLAAQRYPDSMDIQSALAAAYAARGEMALAKAAADKAIEIFQKHPPEGLPPMFLKKQEQMLRQDRAALEKGAPETPRKWSALDGFLDADTSPEAVVLAASVVPQREPDRRVG